MDITLPEMTEREIANIVNDFINFPLEGFIKNQKDMDGAMIRLTGGRFPAESWRYLTVGDLLVLICTSDRISQCGAIFPLFEAIYYTMNEIAEVYLFSYVKGICPMSQTPGLLIRGAMREIDALNNDYLKIPSYKIAAENRKKLTGILQVHFIRIFSVIIENCNMGNRRDEVINRLQMICEDY